MLLTEDSPDQQLVFVTGIDLTPDYALFADVSSQTGFSATLTVDVPAIASAWSGTNFQSSHSVSPFFRSSTLLEENDLPYVPFIRCWRLRRWLWFVKLVKAEAEASELGGYDNWDKDDNSEGVLIEAAQTVRVSLV
jgi:hypothetical protein